MHIAFVQPGKVIMLRYTHPSIYQEVIKYNCLILVPGTRRGMFLQRIGSLKTVPEKFQTNNQ